MLKRGTRARKALLPPATRALVSLATRRVQEDLIPISSSLAVSSSPSTLHPTLAKKKITPHLPAFDPTSALNKPPYYISIFIVPVINGARKEQEIIPLSVDLSDIRQATFKDL
jgi:hypothetical protein